MSKNFEKLTQVDNDYKILTTDNNCSRQLTEKKKEKLVTKGAPSSSKNQNFNVITSFEERKGGSNSLFCDIFETTTEGLITPLKCNSSQDEA